MCDFYVPDNCVISVVGNFKESKLLTIINKYFSKWKSIGYCRLQEKRPDFRTHFLYRKKDTEQTHVCLGFRGLPMSDEKLYALMVLNNILGGGMSSRLFQSIREERGLVYSIYSFPTAFRDCGMFTIYAATNPENAKEVIRLIGLEIKNLIDKGITENELLISKNQLKGNYILSLDSTSGRMSAYGKSKIITGVANSPATVLRQIEDVSKETITELFHWIFEEGQTGVVILGDTPVSSEVVDFLKF
jgi:predicted Zn-dependent peptidase